MARVRRRDELPAAPERSGRSAGEDPAQVAEEALITALRRHLPPLQLQVLEASTESTSAHPGALLSGFLGDGTGGG